MTVPGMPAWALPPPQPPGVPTTPTQDMPPPPPLASGAPPIVMPAAAPAPKVVIAAPPKPNFDPPPGTQIIQRQADGSFAVNPLPPGVAGVPDDAGQINYAALQIGASTGGTIRLECARYQVRSTITLPPYVTLEGQGAPTVLAYYGSGDCVFIQNTTPTGSPNFGTVAAGRGGAIRDITIDGANAQAGATGLHADSMPNGMHLGDPVFIQHFSGAGSTGLHLSNSVSFTEKYQVWANIFDCATACLIEKITGGSESFRYGDLTLDVASLAGQQGVVLQACHILGGSFRIRSNIQASASAGPANWAMLYFSPTSVGGSFATIQGCHVMLFGEIDNANTFNPQTVLFGSTTNNTLTQCWGGMTFQNAFNNSNATTACLSFWGPIGGDTVMQGVVQQPTQVTQPDFTTAPQAVSTPAVPASGTVVTNNQGSAGATCDILVYIAGGTFTAPAQVNGVNTGDVNARFFYLPTGATIKLTYSAAPTSWLWSGV